MKKRAVIWGVGKSTGNFLNKKYLYSNYSIVAFVDNNSMFWGGDKCYKGIPIISPYDLAKTNYDLLIISSIYKDEIYKQIEEMKISMDKVTDVEHMEEAIKTKIIEKYNYSFDDNIQRAVNYYKNNKLNIFADYSPAPHEYEVFWEGDYPYVLLEGKRMYYPKGFFGGKTSEKKIISDVLYEQHENSPHLYVDGRHKISKGDVVVDAGVCEGNFALRYIEDIKKVYLIESSTEWIEPLERTFRPYKDKVVFCYKELARSSSSKTVALDDLVHEKIDFLKMDIEGAEVDAVLGSKSVLLNSNAKCSICCYHRQSDEENLRLILEALGYSTRTSAGTMFFCYDPNIGETLDLRHGIIYAEKVR